MSYRTIDLFFPFTECGGFLNNSLPSNMTYYRATVMTSQGGLDGAS